MGHRGVPKEDFLLFVAVSRGQVDMVKLLLERGAANSGISTVIGGEIYGYAVLHGYTKVPVKSPARLVVRPPNFHNYRVSTL